MRPPSAGSHYLHGSADWYKARLEEVAKKYDAALLKLDYLLGREALRNAQRRDLLDYWELGGRVALALRQENR